MNLPVLHESERKQAPASVFVATALLLFFLSLSAADSVGFVPYYVDGSSPREARPHAARVSGDVALSDLPELGEEQLPAASGQLPENTEEGVQPERIVIASIDLDLPIQNPETRDIGRLDEILKDGPARYVDSALLGTKGNILVFAHSSHLPVVHNQMYKAFNNISELSSGDTITLIGGGKSYIYSVTSIRRADAEEELIDLAPSGNRLTLVTCDTLTSKSSRWVLEAELVGSY